MVEPALEGLRRKAAAMAGVPYQPPSSIKSAGPPPFIPGTTHDRTQAALTEIVELQAEIDRLHAEVDRLTEIGGSREPDGPPPFVLTPPSEELRPLYARLGLGPGEIGPTWKVIRTGVCPQCRGKLDGQGGADDPWRQCAPCALDWAAEWDVFGVREV